MKEDKAMNNETLDFPQIITRSKQKLPNNTSFLLALAGICGGIAAILAGFILILVHAALKGDTVFDEIGTVLMITAIPLMFLGGHFMDKSIEKKK